MGGKKPTVKQRDLICHILTNSQNNTVWKLRGKFMIDELKPKPISIFKRFPNKEDCVEIKRQGIAPKGSYCDKCYYINIELEPRINPWNDEVERTVYVGKCSFFGERLIGEEITLPCGVKSNRYTKCISCLLQTTEK